MIEEFRREHAPARTDASRQHVLELEFLAKDGAFALVRSRQHVLARRPRHADGRPRNHPRRHAAPAGGTGLARVGRQAAQPPGEPPRPRARGRPRREHLCLSTAANRNTTGKSLLGECGFDFITPEYQAICRRALDQAIATGLPQVIEVQDVFGSWWSCRLVPLGRRKRRNGEARHGHLHRRHPATPGRPRRSRRSSNCCGDCSTCTSANGN